MKKPQYLVYISVIISLLIFSSSGFCQDKDKSLAFKKNRLQKNYTIFYQPDLSYQIQKQFNLIRDANSGNPLAQHELGLRYLLGEDGMAADTVEGAYWIQKAATQNLTAACFNYGILLLNGWGVQWSPFLAYKYFLTAANDGMPQAQHVIGILTTDNLIVKRDYVEAYKWVKKAENQGYQPATETRIELEKYLPANIDSSKLNANRKEAKGNEFSADPDSNFSAQLGLVFIDFNLIADTLMKVTDEQLIDDLNHESNKKLADTLGLKTTDKNFNHLTEGKINLLKQYANTGNPEALTILGRNYEQGIFFDRSSLKAAKYYIMASQLDYFRAKALLLKILSQSFMDSLIADVQSAQNDDAMFVIYGLWSLGLYNQISESQAESFLKKAADHNHSESIIELANGYYTGKLRNGSESLAIKIWNQAADNGNFQAKIRLAAANILSGENIEELSKSIKTIKQAVEFGSILAQISLAYCYEKGIGVTKSKAEAVKFYRLAAQRGNSLAYEELKRIYDEIRPKEKRFEIN